jgi:hypothetical protein
MIGKTLLSLMFMASGIVCSFGADMSGTWTVASSLGSSPTCTFTQTENFISGPCKGANADGTAFGVVDGQSVRWAWQWVATAGHNLGAFDFSGDVDRDSNISGVIMVGNQTGSFTAKKQ